MPHDNGAGSTASTPPPNNLRSGVAAELALFRRRKVILAALALIFVPSLYVLIYVSSVWDPYGSFSHLPVALVNQDIPVRELGREVNLGAQLAETLERQRPFGFVRYATADAGKADVRSGKVFFALVIPPNFSARALTSDEPAQLGFYTSEGGNYTASLVGKRFAAELAHSLNERLNHERWAALVGEGSSAGEPSLRRGLADLHDGSRRLLDGSVKVQDGTTRLNEGLTRATDGAEKLAAGSGQLESASARLSGGLRQVAEAVSSIRAKLPDDAKLKELALGSETLSRGAADLDAGLHRLQQGARRLDDGAVQFQAGAAKVPFFGGRLSAGSAQLRTGVSALGQGIDQTVTGGQQLSDGMKQLDSHLQPLALGLVDLNAGLRTMSDRLPPFDQLDLFDRSMLQFRDGSQSLSDGLRQLQKGSAQLQEGTSELALGAGKLSAGLDEAVSRFESGFGRASSQHLAASVEVATEVVAPVPQNGPAFAPYFAALSLWIGAVMMSFVFYFRRLPASMQQASRPVRWLAKTVPLFVLGVLQATVVVGVMKFVLGIHLANPFSVWMAAALGSLTFVSLVVFLIIVLGDAGRLLAVVLLIFQLASSGGIYPIELSPAFYQHVHGYLPFTFLVRAFRATMFSAFNGRWTSEAMLLGLVATGAILCGWLLARWKYVPPADYGPAVEF